MIIDPSITMSIQDANGATTRNANAAPQPSSADVEAFDQIFSASVHAIPERDALRVMAGQSVEYAEQVKALRSANVTDPLSLLKAQETAGQLLGKTDLLAKVLNQVSQSINKLTQIQ